MEQEEKKLRAENEYLDALNGGNILSRSLDSDHQWITLLFQQHQRPHSVDKESLKGRRRDSKSSSQQMKSIPLILDPRRERRRLRDDMKRHRFHQAFPSLSKTP